MQKKPWYIIFCFTGLILFAVYSFGEQQITTAIYDIPLDSPIFKSADLEQTVRYLKDCGINAIVHVPLDNSIIDELHKQGIKAYAQMKVFFGKDHWIEHPESRPKLSNGNLAEINGWYAGVCPTQEWLIERKVKEAEEIAKKYQIDGLWLDFIRWPTKWEGKEPDIQRACFCNSCLERFQKEKQITIPKGLKSTEEISAWIYKNCSQKWYEWRCAVITDTIRKIRNAVTKHRKNAIIGVFVVPWKEEDFDNAIYNVIGQDIEKLSVLIDVFSPMSYHLLCHRDVEWITSLTRWLKIKTNKDIWPIIQLPGDSNQMKANEYEKALRAALAGGSTGVMTFTISNTPGYWWWEIQKKIFTQELEK